MAELKVKLKKEKYILINIIISISKIIKFDFRKDFIKDEKCIFIQTPFIACSFYFKVAESYRGGKS